MTMNKWVLPGVLRVDTVNALSVEVFTLFAQISTGIVIKRINDYIAAHESEEGEEGDAARKLKAGYSQVNRINEYLESDEAKDLADTLASLQYSDVSCTEDINKLKLYREMIIELLSEDEDFRSEYEGEIAEDATRGMKTAYTTKLDKENLSNVLVQIRLEATRNPNYDQAARSMASDLCMTIEKNKNLFKNGSHNINRATVIRKAIYKKDKLRNILRGLDYIIPKIEAGESAYSWRRL